MLKVVVSNPFTNKELVQGSRTHKRVKYLQSLHKLNTTKAKIPNPLKGKPILIFGHSHINYLYNNFSLNNQNKEIEKFKKQLVNDKTKKTMEEGIKSMQERVRADDVQAQRDVKTMKGVVAKTELKKLENLLNEQKKKHAEAERVAKQTETKIHKIQKQIEDLKEKKTAKAEFGCHVLIFRRIKPDDTHKYKKTIKDTHGRRYRQVWAGPANVRGNIRPYNNKRTYRPQEDDDENEDEASLEEVWLRLLRLLQTDKYVAENLEVLMRSLEIHCIIIKDVAERERGQPKKFKPLRQRLFTQETSHAMCRKDITYKLNQAATTFSELFQIDLNQYTQDNFKANSCYLNLIVDTWHDPFEKRKTDGKRMYAELTYESVCAIIGITNKAQDIGISIRESKKFFEKFRLGLDVVNVFGEMLFSYRPENLNSKIFPQVLRVLIHNGHIYKLDNSTKNKLDKMRAKFAKKKTQVDEVNSLRVSDTYMLRKPVLDGCEVHYIDKLDECVKIVQSFEESTKVRFVTNTELLPILFEMISAKYTPNVIFSGNRIMSLGFRVGKVDASIENTDNTAPEDTIMYLDGKELYEEYHKADDLFYNKILRESLRSDYSESVLDVEDAYPMGPTSGYLTKKFNEDKTYNAIDMVKAYTHCLRGIDAVPVFGYFDIYLPYDNHVLEDLTMYCVEVNAKDIASCLLFPCVHSRCFGFEVKFAREQNIDVAVKCFRRPSRLEQVNYQQPIDELYANDKLEVFHKKHIVNKTTGLSEKKFNTAHVCKVFQNFAEAEHYQVKYGGRIYTLQQSSADESLTDEELMDKYFEGMSIEEFYEKYPEKAEVVPETEVVECTHGPKIHILVIDKKQRLVNGYRYIKEMIYNHMAIKMFNLYHDVIRKGIQPKGIKTDAILVSESKEELEKLFEFTPDKIGGIKFESDKSCPDSPIGQRINDPFQIRQPQVSDIPIKDEWDTNEFNTLFDEMINDDNRVLIKGLFPGVGKSTCVTNYKGHKILFVTPFNKLAQQTRVKGHDAITLNMLLGFYGDGQSYAKTKSYDVQPYDCICFDEIMINGPEILQKIDRFMRTHPEKKFFGTGDVDQLQPINFSANNVMNPQQYLLDCINQMFPHQITLTINKRLKTEQQRNMLSQLKKDIFDQTKNPLATLKQHGFRTITKFSQIQSFQNICYFNYRTKQVNSHVHKNLVAQPKQLVTINGIKYWSGLELICKKHYRTDIGRLFVNYTYVIKAINQKQFTVCDVVENKTFTFPVSTLEYFKLPYANTCHSVQGLSLDGPVTIFDVNTPYVDRFYVWTALTRSTDFSQVVVFEHSEGEIEELQRHRVKQYFKTKVDGYKHQDKIAGRSWQADEFVTVDWINEEYSKLKVICCCVCKAPYETVVDENGKVKSNLTVDRIDNTKPHLKTNCRLCCVNCNVTKANRY